MYDGQQPILEKQNRLKGIHMKECNVKMVDREAIVHPLKPVGLCDSLIILIIIVSLL